MDDPDSPITNTLIKLYHLVGKFNLALIALVSSSNSLSIQLHFTDHRIINLIISYCYNFVLATIVYRISKKIYRPQMMVKEEMNTADWIDTQIGNKQHIEIISKPLYEEKYHFELSFISYFIATGIQPILMTLFFLNQENYSNLPINSSTDFIPKSLLLFVLMAIYFGTCLVSLHLLKYSLKEWLPSDYFTYTLHGILIVVSLGLMIVLI